MKYVNESENLKLSMMALKGGTKAVQLAVFHVLKLFVPNPYKSDGILRILIANKKIFINFLSEFEKDSKDEQLIAHKQEMVEAFEKLPDATPRQASNLVSPIGIGGSAGTGNPSPTASPMGNGVASGNGNGGSGSGSGSGNGGANDTSPMASIPAAPTAAAAAPSPGANGRSILSPNMTGATVQNRGGGGGGEGSPAMIGRRKEVAAKEQEIR